MWFGLSTVQGAVGAILAHSVEVDGTRLKKGRVLSQADADLLRAAGISEVTIARLGPEDVPEDTAAAQVADVLVDGGLGLTVSEPFTGRANLLAEGPGLFRVEAAGIHAINTIDPAITVATLADRTRVQARQMVATVKIIPYGVPKPVLERALAAARGVELRMRGFMSLSASLILTRTPGMKESVLTKGGEVVEARLRALGLSLADKIMVGHDTSAVANAIGEAAGDLILILGASATSDAGDTCPAALVEAGGELTRFGMPVDPGNLLFLGHYAGRPVVGLPGCARSPALNGADWVLERLAVGEVITSEDISVMGVGGLLKEIPQRPQPRAGRVAAARRQPNVAVIVLAGGQSRRMRGRDKLLEPVEGEPILTRAVSAALEAKSAGQVMVVLPPGRAERRAVLPGSGVEIVEAREALEGMAGSIRAGLARVQPGADAVVIMLADMPEIGAGELDTLIAAFDPAEGHEICRAVTERGKPGHPVLFGHRFFEALSELRGDQGGRNILAEAADYVRDVPLNGHAAIIDLDSPEDWAAWRARK